MTLNRGLRPRCERWFFRDLLRRGLSEENTNHQLEITID